MRMTDQEIGQLIDTALAHLTHARLVLRPSIGDSECNHGEVQRHVNSALEAVSTASTEHRFLGRG